MERSPASIYMPDRVYAIYKKPSIPDVADNSVSMLSQAIRQAGMPRAAKTVSIAVVGSN